jgi:hypothetical protein
MSTEAQEAIQKTESADLSPEGKAASLLDQISEAALQETGGDVWRARQPLATPNEPPKAEPKAAEGDGTTPAPSKEAPAWQPELDYLKKYQSKEEAEAGLTSLLNTVQDVQTKLLQAEQKLAALQEPPKPEVKDPADELATWGLPSEPIKNVMKQVFTQMLEEAVKPAQERIEADKQIIAKYPEYKEKFNDLSQWLETKPELKSQVLEAERAGHYTLAREYAWLHYTRNGAAKQETEMKAEAQVQAAETKRQKADARTMTTSQSPEPRPRPEDELEARRFIKADEMERLVTLAQAGYEAPLWRRAIGELLPKEVFPDA